MILRVGCLLGANNLIGNFIPLIGEKSDPNGCYCPWTEEYEIKE